MRSINLKQTYPVPKSGKHLALFVLFTLLLGAMSTIGLAAETNTLLPLTHSSTVLGVDKPVNVLLPAGYDPSKRYPTIYILHGATGNAHDWVRRTNIQEYALKYEAILVFPDGNPFSWYLDSPVDPASKYESYIIKELIPYIDSLFATVGSGNGRAIVGLSMGGHGAITLAFKHPDHFASTSSLSGILDITAHPNQWQLPDRLGPLAANHQVWEANSALHLAGKVPADTHLRIKFDSGTSDTAAIYDNRALHARLTVLGIDHIFTEYPGQHDWQYWDTHIDEHLQFHMDTFAQLGIGGDSL